MAAAERPALRPLPAEPFDPTLPLCAKADRKARIWVRGSRYSVPARLAGREVAVRLGGGSVTVTEHGQVLARHELSAHKGAELLVLDHYLEPLARKPGALPGSSALAQARACGGFTAAHERFWTRACTRRGAAAAAQPPRRRRPRRARRCHRLRPPARTRGRPSKPQGFVSTLC